MKRGGGGGKGIFLRGKKGHDCDEDDIKRGSSPPWRRKCFIIFVVKYIEEIQSCQLSFLFFTTENTAGICSPSTNLPSPTTKTFLPPGVAVKGKSVRGEKFQTVAGGGMHRGLAPI